MRLGSPPRVRGKGKSLVPDFAVQGITPACAGKRRCMTLRTPRKEDHPRVCGEKSFFRAADEHLAGSPPRVRGKGIRNTRIQHLNGITPACAGKSIHGSDRGRETWDHPRVCGEKIHNIRVTGDVVGSPTRVRGKVKMRCSNGIVPGITPACAGKSITPRAHLRARSDHPRVCGEKRPRCRSSAARSGSPPRVRGKELREGREGPRMGITPACAGKRAPR